MSRRGIGRIERCLEKLREQARSHGAMHFKGGSGLARESASWIAANLNANCLRAFAQAADDDYFPLPRRTDLFFRLPLQGRTAFGQTPRPTTHKEETMADVKVPQPMDPQDLLKWLVALRRALKARGG